MTYVEFSAYSIIQALLCIWIVVSAWFCFRRTRIRTFLILGLFVTLLWPAFDALASGLLEHSVAQVAKGQTPSVFPFSLMVPGDEIWWTGWQMPAADFIVRFSFAKAILYHLILAILVALLAGSLKDLKRPEAKE